MSNEFIHLHWKAVQRAMARVIADARGQYPARTTAQLSDFRDTIREETMTEQPYETQQKEYTELYLEHAEAIDAVHTAFKQMVDRQIEVWATRFLEQHRPQKWDSSWRCESDKYGKIYKDTWRRAEDGTTVDNWSDAAFRLEFRHRIRDEKSWKQGRVVFRTVIPKNSDEEYRRQCQETFNSYFEQMTEKTESTNIAIKGNQRTLTESTYSFDPTEGAKAYYTSLAQAFDEHVELVPLLTEIYEESYTNLL
jgi:hypothetical protein